MPKLRYILFAFFALAFMNASAQRSYREHLRSGNKYYADSIYDKAEIEYRKALELDPNGTQALYNLGNALLYQDKAQEAMDQYMIAEKREENKANLAQIHHNMGVICQASKDYARAVEYYKQSLRENSTDHETRYNLALAMSQLNNQQNQQQNQQNQQNQQDKQEKEEQQQQQQEQQEQQQNNQQDQQEQQQNQQQEQQENEMSKENAEQLLESAMQDEKDVQEKVKKMMQVRGRKLDKDW